MTKTANILAFLALLVVAAGPAGAEEAPKSWDGTVRAKTLNVREGPGTAEEVLIRLNRGDPLVAFDEDGRWIHIREFDDTGRTGWVSRTFVNLPDDFMAPAFGDEENEFLEWASERGDLAEISVDAEDRLSMVLHADVSATRAAPVAREVACEYRERLDLKNAVVATVWPPEGPAAGWLAQLSCP